MKRLIMEAIAAALTCAAADVSRAVTLEQGYQQMYNRQFDDAHRTFQQWEAEHPSDPLGPACDAAAYLFSEFDRLHILQSEFLAEDKNFVSQHKLTPDPAVKIQLEQNLNRAAQLSASDSSTDAQFAAVLQHGLRSDYLGLIEKRYLAALGESKQGHAAAEKLLSAHPDYYDANVAIGVENYLLSLKPAPVRFVLRVTGSETDREAGLQKLRVAAEKGHLLAPFARLLLAIAALRDKDYPVARTQLTWLVAQYPQNQLFREELAKVK